MKANLISLLLLAALLLSFAPTPMLGASCSVTDLIPCSRAIFNGDTPTSACCAKLKQQQPCFCEYLRNPNLRGYINSPNAKQVSSYCKVPFPNNC
ncbi:hypothetical protein KSP40_PGU017007 [Platanthera guangdongensis]|uniref:Bifunctional inhibitor/plant lipid transfer protein/seed storage helical domain-containing protein n=1 Tax=Platanthera guangdongensis TaxID=2320717 RepID=A0ABR2LH41_9ASPA